MDRAIPLGWHSVIENFRSDLEQWKAPLKMNFFKASLWTLVSRWKTNRFSKFEGWGGLRKLPWNYSFMKKALYIYSWKSIQLKNCPLKAGVQLNLGEILWKVLEQDQTVERPWNGTPGWCAMFGVRLPIFVVQHFLSPNITKNHQKIYKSPILIDWNVN